MAGAVMERGRSMQPFGPILGQLKLLHAFLSSIIECYRPCSETESMFEGYFFVRSGDEIGFLLFAVRDGRSVLVKLCTCHFLLLRRQIITSAV